MVRSIAILILSLVACFQSVACAQALVPSSPQDEQQMECWTLGDQMEALDDYSRERFVDNCLDESEDADFGDIVACFIGIELRPTLDKASSRAYLANCLPDEDDLGTLQREWCDNFNRSAPTDANRYCEALHAFLHPAVPPPPEQRKKKKKSKLETAAKFVASTLDPRPHLTWAITYAQTFARCLYGIGCGKEETGAEAGWRFGALSAATHSELHKGIAYWERHSRYCVRTNFEHIPRAPFPAKDNNDLPEDCDDQDMTLFNGLLCSVGDPRGCDAVDRSQGETGQWWRSPSIVGMDRHHGGAKASMSEEQTWGVFLYLQKTRDKQAFRDWGKWIARTRHCARLGDLCLGGKPPKWCIDNEKPNACTFLPLECVAFEVLAHRFERNPYKALSYLQRLGCDVVMGVSYGLEGGVAPLLGPLLAPTPSSAIPLPLIDNKGRLRFTAPARPLTAAYPITTQVLGEAHVPYEKGYAYHKVAVKIYLLYKLGIYDHHLRKAARILRDLFPTNAFYVYLAEGPTQHVADLILQTCPAPDTPPTGKRHQWIWERDPAEEKTPAKLNTSYWDCIFAAKLLTNHPEMGPPIVRAMQRQQIEAINEVVRDPFAGSCADLQSEVNAKAQSPTGSDTSDFQITFDGPPSTTFPKKHWYGGTTFVAPCTGRYAATVSAKGADAIAVPVTLDLVSTYRYGTPLAILRAPPSLATSCETTFHLQQNEAVSLVLRRSAESAESQTPPLI